MRCRSLLLGLLLAAPLRAETTLLPECLLDYGVAPERFVLVVEKSSQTLAVYSTLKPAPVATFRITSGRMPGQKTVEGDQRTPEGIYFFETTLTGNALPKSDDYGEKAFTMNYPNPADQLAGREGSGIWMHGAFDREKTKSPNNSRGCVVMANSDLPRISRYVTLNQTPICIYDKVPLVSPDVLRSRREQLLGTLKSWELSWESKDIDRYIGFFAPSFHQKGMNLAQFKQYKTNLNKLYRFIKLNLTGIELYQHGATMVARFDQLYVSNVNQMSSRKIQYWKEIDGRPRILSESASSLPVPTRVEIEPGRTVSLEQFRKAPEIAPTPVPLTVPSPAAPSEPARPPVAAPGTMLVPPGITLSRLETSHAVVTLTIQSALDSDLRAVPVLLQLSGKDAVYRTLDGVRLHDGVPSDFRRGLPLPKGASTLSIPRDPGLDVRSLTLFVADGNGSVRQIHTYLLGR